MLVAHYPHKKNLVAEKGQPLFYTETTMFRPEFREDGTFVVTGPSVHKHDWYAMVTMENGLIKKVK